MQVKGPDFTRPRSRTAADQYFADYYSFLSCACVTRLGGLPSGRIQPGPCWLPRTPKIERNSSPRSVVIKNPPGYDS